MELLVGLIVGLAVGAVAAWFVATAQSRRREAEARAVLDSERSDLARERAVGGERLEATQRDLNRVQSERDLFEKRLDAARDEAEQRVDALRGEITELKEKGAELQTELEKDRKQASEKLALLEEAKKQLTDAFDALSSKALKSNNQSFLDLAQTHLAKFQETARGDLDKRQKAVDEMVKPIRESLDRVEKQTREIESARKEAYGSLSQQVKSLGESQQRLQGETANLVQALRAPQVRGKWGEFQLRRVAEMAGMIPYCDFHEQVTTDGEDGRQRPDMVVRLPNDQVIVVDSKVSLIGYYDAMSADTDEARDVAMSRHARHVRDHVKALAGKNYWKEFDQTPEFVVLFMPAENFFSTAVRNYPDLIEDGVRQGVIIATPTTLIALLKAVAYGWKQESLAENARKISQLGQEIYGRLATFSQHLASVGKGLQSGMSAYNRAVGSLERQVLPSARRFPELGVSVSGAKPIPELDSIEEGPRQIQAPELVLPEPETSSAPGEETSESSP